MSIRPPSVSRQDWATPPEVLAIVRRLGEIGLDPCSNAHSIVGAKVEWRKHNPPGGSLGLPWAGYGLVYVNPPYGRGGVTKLWVEKASREAHLGAELVLLVPASVGTDWFRRYILGIPGSPEHAAAAALYIWPGRIKFIVPERPDGGRSQADFDSALAYYGSRAPEFLASCPIQGWRIRQRSVLCPTSSAV